MAAFLWSIIVNMKNLRKTKRKEVIECVYIFVDWHCMQFVYVCVCVCVCVVSLCARFQLSNL